MKRVSLTSSRPARSGTFILLTLGTALSACGQTVPGTVTVRDSAGVTIVENGPDARISAERWTVAAEPSLRIGTVEGDSMRQFTRVTDGVRLDDGRIIVADAGARQLRAFGPEGVFLWKQGRAGGGPGEYVGLSDVVRLGGDTVAILDRRARRLTVLGSDGTMGRSVPVDAPLPAGTPGVSPSADVHRGRLLVSGHAPGAAPRAGAPADGSDYRWQTLYLLDSNGAVTTLDTVRWAPMVPGPGGRSAWPRYGWNTQITASDDGLYMGTGEAYEVGRYDDRFRLERLIRWTGPDRTVTKADLEEYFRLYVIRSRTPPEGEAELRSSLDEVPAADRKPAYFELRTDRAGRLWVRDLDLAWLHPPDSLRWTVFDPLGRLLARAVLPGSVLPLEIGEDYVLARWRDELDVDHVALYDLVRSRPSEH